jgi:ATPase subunit of ABC transporter with duplicated ATPase domains
MEDALADYGEALLFVSHDRWFIEKFATRIWCLHDGIIEDFKGGFNAWREYKNRQEALQQTARAAVRQKAPKKKAEPNRDRRRARVEKEIERAEAAIAALEAGWSKTPPITRSSWSWRRKRRRRTRRWRRCTRNGRS